MNSTGRRTFRAAKFLAVGAAMLLAPALLVGQMTDFGCIGAELKELQAAVRHDRELNAQIQRAFARQQAHAELVNELIAGRATLAETAQRFGKICEDAPDFPIRGVQATIAASCDQERWCKCVLACARMALSDRPDLGDTVSVRLDAEMQRLARQWPSRP